MANVQKNWFFLWVVPKQLSSKSFVRNIMLFFVCLFVDLFPYAASCIFAKISSFIEKYQFPNTRMHICNATQKPSTLFVFLAYGHIFIDRHSIVLWDMRVQLWSFKGPQSLSSLMCVFQNKKPTLGQILIISQLSNAINNVTDGRSAKTFQPVDNQTVKTHCQPVILSLVAKLPDGHLVMWWNVCSKNGWGKDVYSKEA